MRQLIRKFIIFILSLLLLFFASYTVFRMYEESEIIKFKRNETVEKQTMQKVFDGYIAEVRNDNKQELEKLKTESDKKVKDLSDKLIAKSSDCNNSQTLSTEKQKLEDDKNKLNQAQVDLEKEKSKLRIAQYELKQLMEKHLKKEKQITESCKEKYHREILQSCMKFLGIPANQLHIAESRLWMMGKNRDKYQSTKNVFVCIDQSGKKFPYFLMSGPDDILNKCRKH